MQSGRPAVENTRHVIFGEKQADRYNPLPGAVYLDRQFNMQRVLFRFIPATSERYQLAGNLIVRHLHGLSLHVARGIGEALGTDLARSTAVRVAQEALHDYLVTILQREMPAGASQEDQDIYLSILKLPEAALQPVQLEVGVPSWTQETIQPAAEDEGASGIDFSAVQANGAKPEGSNGPG
jgi:hypothetical protein